MDYEAIIFSTIKDYNKIKYTLQSFNNLSPQPSRIHIVSPNTGIRLYLRNVRKQLIFHTDGEIIPAIDRTLCKYRPNWIWQQFAKLFCDLSDTRYYLVVDSDLYFNKKVEIFSAENEKPQLFLGLDQHHVPYFHTMRELWNVGRQYPHSFINDFMLFNKDVIQGMVGKFGNPTNLYKSVCKTINSNSEYYSFSEFEGYGNFVTKYFPNMYNITRSNSERFVHQGPWRDQEIEELIRKKKDSECQVFAFHTWI